MSLGSTFCFHLQIDFVPNMEAPDFKPYPERHRPPYGYNPDEAQRRVDAGEYWNYMPTFVGLDEDEEFVGHIYARYFGSGSDPESSLVFHSYRQSEHLDRVHKVVREEEFINRSVDTPVFRGEEVDVWISAYRSTTLVRRGQKDTDGSPPDLSNVRLLHSAGSRRFPSGWAYWSNNKITAAPRRDEIGAFSSKGRGQFSKDAELLLSWIWESGKRATEHMPEAKQICAATNAIVDEETLRSASSERGFVERDRSSVALCRLRVSLRKDIAEAIGLEAENVDNEYTFYVIREVYVYIGGDASVDHSSIFCPDLETAEDVYFSTYGVRRRFRDAATLLKVKHERRAENRARRRRILEAGAEDSPSSGDGATGALFFNPSPPSKEDSQFAMISSVEGTPENRLIFAINHYVSTGDHFGEGIFFEKGNQTVFALPVNAKNPTDLDDFQKFKSAIDALSLDSVELVVAESTGAGSRFLMHELHVDSEAIPSLADQLMDSPGPEGWGSPKAIIDEHDWDL